MANSLQRPDFSVPKTAVVESFGCSSCRKRWKVLPYAFVKIINMNVLFWKSIVQSVHFETPISVKKNPKSLQKKHKISSESDRKWREEHWWPLAEEDWKCKVSDNYLEVISKSGSHIYFFHYYFYFFNEWQTCQKFSFILRLSRCWKSTNGSQMKGSSLVNRTRRTILLLMTWKRCRDDWASCRKLRRN